MTWSVVSRPSYSYGFWDVQHTIVWPWWPLSFGEVCSKHAPARPFMLTDMSVCSSCREASPPPHPPPRHETIGRDCCLKLSCDFWPSVTDITRVLFQVYRLAMICHAAKDSWGWPCTFLTLRPPKSRKDSEVQQQSWSRNISERVPSGPGEAWSCWAGHSHGSYSPGICSPYSSWSSPCLVGLSSSFLSLCLETHTQSETERDGEETERERVFVGHRESGQSSLWGLVTPILSSVCWMACLWVCCLCFWSSGFSASGEILKPVRTVTLNCWGQDEQSPWVTRCLEAQAWGQNLRPRVRVLLLLTFCLHGALFLCSRTPQLEWACHWLRGPQYICLPWTQNAQKSHWSPLSTRWGDCIFACKCRKRAHMETSCGAVIGMITRYTTETKAAESEAEKIKQRNTQLSICLQTSWFRAAV
jgi:hypothetical protein